MAIDYIDVSRDLAAGNYALRLPYHVHKTYILQPCILQRTVFPQRYHSCPQPMTYQPTKRFHTSPLPVPASPMSTSSQTSNLSTANFTAIFNAASIEYRTITKQDLETHPFAAAFEISNSPDTVMIIFRKQAQAFDTFRKGDDQLLTRLTPIVNILLAFSGTLGEGLGLVSIKYFYDISALRHLLSLAFLTRKDSLHWYWYSSRGQSIFSLIRCPFA
jgi:hypothetical protein